jgi:hypothetical protein
MLALKLSPAAEAFGEELSAGAKTPRYTKAYVKYVESLTLKLQ